MFTVCFLSSAVRCQPLSRALVSLRKDHQKFTPKVLKIQLLAFKLHNWTFKFGLMLIW
ncbi:acetyltransferase [Vibrio cholerae]|nr:acetyltransferase [Vibrio cholerae]